MKILFSLFASVFLVGCGGDADTGVEMPSAPTAPAAPVVDAPSPAAPPVTPPPSDTTPAPVTAAPAGPAESSPMDASAQERILAAMQSYVIDNSANPKSLEELVSRGYLKSLPPAPAGKKWVYNPESLGVELADK